MTRRFSVCSETPAARFVFEVPGVGRYPLVVVLDEGDHAGCVTVIAASYRWIGRYVLPTRAEKSGFLSNLAGKLSISDAREIRAALDALAHAGRLPRPPLSRVEDLDGPAFEGATPDELAGVAWWNGLSPDDRRAWSTLHGERPDGVTPAEAFAAWRAGGRP